jgi:hypothetical protein
MSDEDDVRAILTPVREAKIYRAFKQAWADFLQDRPRYPRWPRTRANMMFERLSIRLQEQFIDDPGIHFTFHDETVKIIADQKLMARCKKADNRGLGHNVPTQANDLFCEQASLAFVTPFDKVEIVYVINDLSTEISKVIVQARDGDARLWAYEIDDTALATIAPVTPLPTGVPSIVPDASDLVQPRTKPATKEEEDKN